MSSLEMLKTIYGSSDESSNEEVQVETVIATQSKLPLPDSIALLDDPFAIEDESINHHGRKRSFKHERGNWATFVGFLYNEIQLVEFKWQINRIISLFEVEFKSGCKWFITDDFHVSLSRTVVVPHHFIEPLVESLRSKFADINNFMISFSSQDLRFYVNDEKSRSFIGFEITDFHNKTLIKKLVDHVDDTFRDYRCDKFYKEASYHLSTSWCLGDVTQNHHCKKMLQFLKQKWMIVEEDVGYLFSFKVDQIFLKCGNKQFTFRLK